MVTTRRGNGEDPLAKLRDEIAELCARVESLEAAMLAETLQTIDPVAATEHYIAAVAAEHGTTTDEVRAEYVSALDISTWKEVR